MEFLCKFQKRRKCYLLHQLDLYQAYSCSEFESPNIKPLKMINNSFVWMISVTKPLIVSHPSLWQEKVFFFSVLMIWYQEIKWWNWSKSGIIYLKAGAKWVRFRKIGSERCFILSTLTIRYLLIFMMMKIFCWKLKWKPTKLKVISP